MPAPQIPRASFADNPKRALLDVAFCFHLLEKTGFDNPGISLACGNIVHDLLGKCRHEARFAEKLVFAEYASDLMHRNDVAFARRLFGCLDRLSAQICKRRKIRSIASHDEGGARRMTGVERLFFLHRRHRLPGTCARERCVRHWVGDEDHRRLSPDHDPGQFASVVILEHEAPGRHFVANMVERCGDSFNDCGGLSYRLHGNARFRPIGGIGAISRCRQDKRK